MDAQRVGQIKGRCVEHLSDQEKIGLSEYLTTIVLPKCAVTSIFYREGIFFENNGRTVIDLSLGCREKLVRTKATEGVIRLNESDGFDYRVETICW